jgi:hypothetical protein
MTSAGSIVVSIAIKSEARSQEPEVRIKGGSQKSGAGIKENRIC